MKGDHKTGLTASTLLLVSAWLAVILMLARAEPAFAHRVNIFAWVEGDEIHTESRFPGGRKVKEGRISVYDLQGKHLLEGTTDEKGFFSFRIPQKTGLKIVLEAGMGHKAHWILEASELGGATTGAAVKGGPDSAGVGASKPQDEATASPSVLPVREINVQEIQSLIEEILDEKLEPIRRMLAASQDRGPSVREIIGGIGYIVGLIGIAAYFSSRRRN